jgi:KDEL-tailed cysteine endopeptidase
MSFESKEYEQVFAKGLIRNKEKHQQFKEGAPKRVSPKTAGPIPGKLDLKSKVSPPENQGNCGSCWDFSITKALRSEFMLAGKDPGALAFNYLLNNCGPVHEYGCGGGDFDAGQNMLGGRGPWLESEDPYRQSESQCKIGLKVAATAKNWVLVGDGGKPSFKELAEAMYNNGAGHALSVDVAADNSWSNYSSGIYNRNTSSGINHMINCVGYDMETSVDAQGNALFNAQGQPVNGDGFLILMNNWGNQWGENGYMRSRWGMNSVAETAMYFEVERPTPPPPPPPVPEPDLHIPTWLYFAAGITLVVGVGIAFIVGKNSK